MKQVFIALLLSVAVLFLFKKGELPIQRNATAIAEVTPQPSLLAPEIVTGPMPVFDTVSFLRSIDTTMILVQGGKFMMGNDTLHEASAPRHPVELGSFYISKFMLTVEQFKFFVDNTGYKTAADTLGGGYVLINDDSLVSKAGVDWKCDELGNKKTQKGFPVLYVNWQDANAFCNWLSGLSGKQYRLPTEAEWEFAAIGGNKSKGFRYSGSNDLDEVAWHGKNAGLRVHPVGTKKANELGLFDMSGNVWQWCNDWYASDYFAKSPRKNPKGAALGDEIVCRGGCFLSGFKTDTKPQLEIHFRGKDEVNLVANDAAFRIVRDL